MKKSFIRLADFLIMAHSYAIWLLGSYKYIMYYVYYYLRRDGVTPYYVGKGKNRRAWESHRRSNGCDLRPRDKSRIVLVKQNLTEDEAWQIERELIAKWGRLNEGGVLVNRTDGGSGGQTVTSESRRGTNNPRWGVKEDPSITHIRKVRMIKTKNADNLELYKTLIQRMNAGESATSLAKKTGVHKGVVCRLKNRTHGIFLAFPELI